MTESLKEKIPFCKRFALKLLLLLLELAALAIGLQLIDWAYLAQRELAASMPWEIDWAATEFPLRNFLLVASVLVGFRLLQSQHQRALVVAAVSLVHLGLFRYEALIYVIVSAFFLWRALGSRKVPGRAANLRFWLCFVIFVFVGPKLFLWLPFLHWMPECEVLFQGLFLRYCYLYYERIKGILPPCSFAEFLAYLVFLPQIYGMLNFPASEMFGHLGQSFRLLGRAAQSILLAAIKLATLWWLEHSLLNDFGFRLGFTHIASLGRAELWLALLVNYVAWFLLLSSSFDLLVGIIRFLGVPVENNFRWALLAASPVQLWRRWNIYNRKLLLKFIYFPLGGNRKNVYLNILLTFLASAILLHSGWFGGPWLYPDPWYLLDECVYFLIQGVLVCAAYWLTRQFPEHQDTPDAFSRPPHQHPLRRLVAARQSRLFLKVGGICFTLLASSWAHIIILMNGSKLKFDDDIATLAERFQLMLYALGIPN